MTKKLIGMLLCVSMTAVLIMGCGSGSTGETGEKEDGTETEEKKEITVVGNGSFYPIIYTDDNGELTGFEHDVIEEIAKRSGLEVKWELSDDYSAMFSGLDSGKYDTIVGQVSVTDEREKTYTFTEKYASNNIRMAVRGDDEAESVDDLQGRKVCIEFGTVLETFFNDYNADLPDDKKIEMVVTSGNIYDELAVGHYDAFPITELSFDSINEKGEYDFKLIGDPIIVDYQAFPFSKEADSDVVESFNLSIKEMREDGTLSKLSEQYYHRDVTDIVE